LGELVMTGKRCLACLRSATLIAALTISSSAQGAACTPTSWVTWSPCGNNGLNYSIATDKPSYLLGEAVTFSITASNPTSSPVTLNFYSLPDFNYRADQHYQWYGPGNTSVFVLSSRVVPANDSINWQLDHPMNEYAFGVGQHSLVGRINGYANTQPTTFLVTAPSDAVHGDFDGDGVTDASDYIVYASTLGQTLPVGIGADVNGDGMITAEDIQFWRANFGWSAATGLGSSSPSVPEPTATACLALGALATRWHKNSC
jgi:hypothetical protein